VLLTAWWLELFYQHTLASRVKGAML